ncbi:MAG: hypothetical protein ABII97_01180 [Patescibacteria group bacterium]
MIDLEPYRNSPYGWKFASEKVWAEARKKSLSVAGVLRQTIRENPSLTKKEIFRLIEQSTLKHYYVETFVLMFHVYEMNSGNAKAKFKELLTGVIQTREEWAELQGVEIILGLEFGTIF